MGCSEREKQESPSHTNLPHQIDVLYSADEIDHRNVPPMGKFFNLSHDQIEGVSWYANDRIQGLLTEAHVGKADSFQSEEASAGSQRGGTQHHPFWPLQRNDVIGLFLTAVGLMIAAGGGIGMC